MIRPTPVPRVRGGRRYCIYDKYFAKGRAAGFETEEMAPILFYTGNESPHEPPPPHTHTAAQAAGTFLPERPLLG